jgi:gamma-tubulin complex component 2
LKGVEAFTLQYEVSWPLSIILSHRAITKYQLLARLLYFSKHVERRLLTSWMSESHIFSARSGASPFGVYSGGVSCLRHRMLHFMQNFVYYITLEVIGPREHELQEALSSCEDMDGLLEAHEKFLDTCLRECLLASQSLLRILTKLMTTCLLLAEQLQREEMEIVTRRKEKIIDEVDMEQLEMKVKMLSKFSNAFDEQVLIFSYICIFYSNFF